MFENHLLIDGKAFAEGKKISAKRPTEYWLTFMKNYVLTYKKSKFRAYYLVFAAPIVLGLILFLIGMDLEVVFPVIFVSFFVCIFISVFMSMRFKQALVPINAFHDLAKFIISIKGDIYRDRFSMRLNSEIIEEDINLLDPNKLGLTKRQRTVYKPYELERFKAVFHLKDYSVCTISLHQVVLRVTTTRRRSSGKTKTKMKRKHKYFHQLSLKLDASQYKIIEQKFLPVDRTNGYEVRTKKDTGFYYVKVKSKQKLLSISSTIKEADTHKDSIFTEMMQYLEHYNIVTAKTPQNLI